MNVRRISGPGWLPTLASDGPPRALLPRRRAGRANPCRRGCLETIDHMTTREAGGAGESAVLDDIAERITEGLKRMRAQRSGDSGPNRATES